MTKAYEDLTPQGQARRLRVLAEAALDQFGFEAYHLRLIKHLVNTTFRLDCDEGRFVVRVHRGVGRTLSQIESEVAWMEALAKDTSIVLQTPRRASNGRLVVVAEVPGCPTPCPVTVLSWLEGRVLPSEKRGPRHFELLGKLVAQIHEHAQVWRPPDSFDRPQLGADGLIGPNAAYPLQQLESRLPKGVRNDLYEVYERLLELESAVQHRRELHGLIHRDLTFSNTLYAARDARPIDFDECGWGCYLHDLGASLNGARWTYNYAEHSAVFFAAYRQIRPLDDALLAHMPLLLSTRTAGLILYAAAQSPTHDWIRQMGQWVRELLSEINAG